MFYYEILEAFYKHGIKYLLVGGLAVILYGIPRTTQDIDVVISMNEENVKKMNKILKNLGYRPRLPVNPDDLAKPEVVKKWVNNKNLKAFSFYHKKESYKIFDIVIVNAPNFEEAFKNRNIKKVKDIEIYLASIDDLILMKESSDRLQDLSDAELLKKSKKWMGENE